MTAITLVAVGTSLPDTFASMTAARNSEYADAAIGNVTGSNSVNVFVGLGLPWLISAYYAQNHNQKYETPPGNLAFSVTIFLITSLTCFLVLGLRRYVSNKYLINFHHFLIIVPGGRVGRTGLREKGHSGLPHQSLDFLCDNVLAQGLQSALRMKEMDAKLKRQIEKNLINKVIDNSNIVCLGL